jgi:hypothetical protein
MLGRAESDALAARLRTFIESRGFGLWAVEVLGGEPFVGFVGLHVPDFDAPFTRVLKWDGGWPRAGHSWCWVGADGSQLQVLPATELFVSPGKTAIALTVAEELTVTGPVY